jgi:hypothetical protein
MHLGVAFELFFTALSSQSKFDKISVKPQGAPFLIGFTAPFGLLINALLL